MRRLRAPIGSPSVGDVYVFPKLDGTNASAWWDPETGAPACASRRRRIAPEDDNAGFAQWVQFSDEAAGVRQAIHAHPSWILYGEWLVPHTLKTYREDAWRRFWVFDVFNRETERFVDYPTYSEALSSSDVDVIEPQCLIETPSEEQLRREVDGNTYLICDGMGSGEGVGLVHDLHRDKVRTLDASAPGSAPSVSMIRCPCFLRSSLGSSGSPSIQISR